MPARSKLTLAILIVASSATAVPASQYHHGRRQYAVERTRPSFHTNGEFSPYPARMIERRPGLWISTFDCVTDEGYGRFRPCNAN